ncbi:DNA repair protein RAD50 isoform X1 [Octopus sinensis]|uniref:DNA repair protein RAD50 isoform X1 n=2 Tax=Octopus sinensis TaxID=2607531 RepID=A0A6P7SXV9_9MOLL|nr:DNA repair protein RAD50 isoform X1 [Octopus sinensis]XP_036358581.1 DNA repair protein RAD50 isoform X1 [Octopus sinensis]XP_036358582.1 DNA repair protein RAD50 isoform X1 [Octopus sinensis]
MSTIKKMSIQGIRSFGPEDSDKQVISFFCPLTLILGQNGTGKTTIIESLKYITTGDLPPGSKTNGAFVHDPKIAHEKEVKAQVKLHFKDIIQKDVIVSRAMTGTQKAKKVETRTLDGVITRRSTDGDKSLTQKCAEINREMIISLGVSKAVLENVIFCHQEEANWPLSEGKVLKEKFDAIFASTRYVKALESIRKYKQVQDGSIKEKKTDLKYLKEHKEKVTQLENNKSELESKYAASKDSVKKMMEELEPIKEKIHSINVRSEEMYKLKNDIEVVRTERKQLQISVEELRKNIETEFEGSTAELQTMINKFEDNLQEKEDSLSEFNKKLDKLANENEGYEQEKSILLVEIGKLDQEATNNEENIQARADLVMRLATKYNIDDFDKNTIDNKTTKNFIEMLNNTHQQLMSDVKIEKKRFEEKEQSIQQEMDGVKEKKVQLEQRIKMEEEITKKNIAEIQKCEYALQQMESSARYRDEISADLKSAQKSLKATEESINVAELKKEIQNMSQEKKTLEEQYDELDGLLKKMHQHSTVQTQISMLDKEKTAKEEQIKKCKSRHETSIIHLLGEMPRNDLRGTLDEYVSKQSNNVQKSTEKLDKLRQDLSSKETQKRMLLEEMRKRENELKKLEEKLQDACGEDTFEDSLQSIQLKLTQVQDQRGSLMGSEHFFKKFVVDLKKDSPCCPLCHRGFEQEQEIRELILELENKLRMVPSKLHKSERELEQYQKEYDTLQQLKPIKENLTLLSTTDLPDIKNKLDSVNNAIVKLNKSIQEAEEDQQDLMSDESLGKSILPDILMIDRYLAEVKELNKKSRIQKSLISDVDMDSLGDRSLEDVSSEKDTIQSKLRSTNHELELQRQKLSNYSDKVNELHSRVNSLNSEKLQIEKNLQEKIKLEENKDDLHNQNVTHKASIKKLKEELKPLQASIDKLVDEKDSITTCKEDTLEKRRKQAEEIQQKGVSQLKSYMSIILNYEKSGKAALLEEKKERCKSLNDKVERITNKRNQLQDSVSKIRKELSKEKMRKRELDDTFLLREKEKDIEKLQDKVEILKKKLGDYGDSSLAEQLRSLKKKQEKLDREKDIAVGRQDGFQVHIASINEELASDMYKNAFQRYQQTLIDLRTTEMANLDLQKYYAALDVAIMKYHNLKMKEINKIIRDLWRNTYRGNDIETIEIRSSEDESGIMKSRRNYNYHVVMIKGDAVIDMRGRCSAGQKVLASIVIRLALAETFCINCGILTLDEPTTNLDQENIESLANALVDIIKSRQEQQNFQLVIITHDENFVQILGRLDVKEYYRVKKNENGCSRIKRVSVWRVDSDGDNDLH